MEQRKHLLIRCINPKTVSFFAKHDALVASLPRFIDALADALADNLSHASEASRQDDVGKLFGEMRTFLGAFEARQSASIGEKLSEMRESVERSVGTLGAQVQERMVALMFSVESSVRSALEQLNVQKFSSTICENMIPFLSEQLSKIGDRTQTLGDAMSNFERRIAEEVSAKDALTRSHQEHLMSVLGSVPAHVGQIVSEVCKSQASSSEKSNSALQEKLLERLLELREKVHCIAEIPTSQAVIREVLGKLSCEVCRLSQDHAVSGPALNGQLTELLKGVASKVEGNGTRTEVSVALLHKASQDVVAKIDSLARDLTRQSMSNKHKGQVGEGRLYDMLCDRLTSREDFTVELVTGQAHNCDLNIKKLGHTDVRLESKAHGEGTGEKVRAKEVARFQSDLLNMNAHGIFVSLHSGIVGKGEIEIDVLANGRFAVYLSNNKYDTGIIQDMLNLIYRLDRVKGVRGVHNQGSEGEFRQEDEDCVRVSLETMQRVKLYLKDFGGKVSTLRTHLKEGIAILNELTFETVERMLLGGTVRLPTPLPRANDKKQSGPCVCERCQKTYKTRSSYMAHIKKCC